MGPLAGIKIIEFGGIGAVPFCGQMLADMGAEIIRFERKGGPKSRLGEAKYNIWFRNRISIFLDLKNTKSKDVIFRLIEKADATIEGFRPGVMERLGYGPDECAKLNPKLIYGRLTGYGREGSLCLSPGHDINYLALSGGLNAIGHRGERPIPPLNLLGDLAGGGLMLAFGIACALLEREKSGKGQVVDASMVDGCAALMGTFYGWWAGHAWKGERGLNLLDSGAPFYDTYETSDGKYVAVGAIEPEFYRSLVERAGIDVDPEDQMNTKKWPELREKLGKAFRSKTRHQWCEIMAGANTCFAPVLSFREAIEHPHNVTRKTFVDVEDVVQPAPTPRFSRTRPQILRPPSEPGADAFNGLIHWGLKREDIIALHNDGFI